VKTAAVGAGARDDGLYFVQEVKAGRSLVSISTDRTATATRLTNPTTPTSPSPAGTQPHGGGRRTFAVRKGPFQAGMRAPAYGRSSRPGAVGH
jgi:hypothetical protein